MMMNLPFPAVTILHLEKTISNLTQCSIQMNTKLVTMRNHPKTQLLRRQQSLSRTQRKAQAPAKILTIPNLAQNLLTDTLVSTISTVTQELWHFKHKIGKFCQFVCCMGFFMECSYVVLNHQSSLPKERCSPQDVQGEYLARPSFIWEPPRISAGRKLIFLSGYDHRGNGFE